MVCNGRTMRSRSISVATSHKPVMTTATVMRTSHE
jgi:hypothetical protein